MIFVSGWVAFLLGCDDKTPVELLDPIIVEHEEPSPRYNENEIFFDLESIVGPPFPDLIAEDAGSEKFDFSDQIFIDDKGNLAVKIFPVPKAPDVVQDVVEVDVVAPVDCDLSYDFSSCCGDGICQEDESPFFCPADCI